jgi:hypothetical protein
MLPLIVCRNRNTGCKAQAKVFALRRFTLPVQASIRAKRQQEERRAVHRLKTLLCARSIPGLEDHEIESDDYDKPHSATQSTAEQ